MPDLHELEERNYDIDGRPIVNGSVVEVVSPIATSARPNDIPPKERLLVVARSGGAFYVQDAEGITHVSQGVRLRIVRNGSPDIPVTTLEFAPNRVPADSARMRSARRGAAATRQRGK